MTREYVPTLEEIRRMCRLIQREWSADERRKRATGDRAARYVETRIVTVPRVIGEKTTL